MTKIRGFNVVPIDIGSYMEIVSKDRDGNPTVIRIWSSSRKTRLLIEKRITYRNGNPIRVEERNFETKQTVVKTITYSKGEVKSVSKSIR
jgi:hypothetical protein